MPDITTLFEGTEGVSRTLFNQKLSDINTHGKDGNSHISTALHTRTGTVNNLAVDPGAKNLTFLAVADLADGDTWTVNGSAVTAVLQNGEALPGELFKAGCWVTGVRLSDDGTQLFFKGAGGAISQDYDFPLSIQTADAIGVNTNHIWIVNDNKLPLIIDDAPRVTDGDCYYGILDTQKTYGGFSKNGYRLTDGSKVNVSDRMMHSAYSNQPWTPSTARDIKVNGTGRSLKAPFPRVMSKINGVVDLETAKRWDGSAWQYISQKGSIAVAGKNLFSITENGASLESVAPSASDSLGERTVISKDGSKVFIGSRYYKRIGTTLSLVQTLTHNSSNIISVTSVSDDNSICVAYSNTLGMVVIYKLNTTTGLYGEINQQITHPAYGAGGSGVISPDGKRVVTLHVISTESNTYFLCRVFKFDGTTFVLENSATRQQTADGLTIPVLAYTPPGIAWSGDSKKCYLIYPNNSGGNYGDLWVYVLVDDNDITAIYMSASFIFNYGSYAHIAVNYDGSKNVMSCTCSHSDIKSVYANTNDNLYTGAGVSGVAISLDGRRIFMSGKPGYTGKIFWLNAQNHFDFAYNLPDFISNNGCSILMPYNV
ncbi:hypothetical protein [Faecalispora anaeroviscerum]|uniref:hypothetical protein n=1 Tax=Faecalispora anaeroviscerum TaxID=2991836 RepID=UPI0024B9E1B5|nr:hypothetical protein [Faecalispora anaeroviscerum]